MCENMSVGGGGYTLLWGYKDIPKKIIVRPLTSVQTFSRTPGFQICVLYDLHITITYPVSQSYKQEAKLLLYLYYEPGKSYQLSD
jgi:hypothetical protein